MFRRISVILVAVLCCCSVLSAKQVSTAKLVEVKKIWEEGQYNSFTDLVLFKGKLYCAFREAKKHGVSTDGSIRVLVSSNGDKWKPAAFISSEKGDLRDPHLTVTPEDKLMLSVCISNHPQPNLISASYFSNHCRS